MNIEWTNDVMIMNENNVMIMNENDVMTMADDDDADSRSDEDYYEPLGFCESHLPENILREKTRGQIMHMNRHTDP